MVFFLNNGAYHKKVLIFRGASLSKLNIKLAAYDTPLRTNIHYPSFFILNEP